MTTSSSATEATEKSGSEPLFGIVELRTDGRWSSEAGKIRLVLEEYFGADITASMLPPPDDHAELRSRLRSAAPLLARLGEGVSGLFALGAGGVRIAPLGLGELPVDQKRECVYALAEVIGDVTETEPVNHRVLWDLRALPEENREYSKFSQADGEAQYHTDSTIVPVPERYFMLYAVQQANCGGGLSMFQDGRIIKQRLEQTPEGREAVRVLTTTRLPLRIPKAFRAKYGYTEKDGYTYVTMMSNEKPLWRWRRDKIEQGLNKHPEYATPAVRKALATVDAQLASSIDEVLQVLPTDGIVIMDNHVAFHGRTAFTDKGRHLLRIRFQEAGA
jgi:alpha-ketoglutarate-dependent taurine dioxygenase